MAWEVILLDEVEDWFLNLDPETADLVVNAIDLLEDQGPTLGRPTPTESRAPRSIT